MNKSLPRIFYIHSLSKNANETSNKLIWLSFLKISWGKQCWKVLSWFTFRASCRTLVRQCDSWITLKTTSVKENFCHTNAHITGLYCTCIYMIHRNQLNWTPPQIKHVFIPRHLDKYWKIHHTLNTCIDWTYPLCYLWSVFSFLFDKKQ